MFFNAAAQNAAAVRAGGRGKQLTKKWGVASVAAVGPMGVNRRPRSSQILAGQGFTLVEVLLAILIFGIMMTALYSAFHLQFMNTDAVGQNMRMNEAALTCLSQMANDLQSLTITERIMYNPSEVAEKPDVYRIRGELNEGDTGSLAKLRFASSNHTSISSRMPGGVGEIVYYLDPLTEGRYFLRRADYNVFEAPDEVDGQDPILCDDVTSLKFVYYDQDGNELETWDSDSDSVSFATPRAVRIQLAIGDPENPDRFDVMVHLPVYREKQETES